MYRIREFKAQDEEYKLKVNTKNEIENTLMQCKTMLESNENMPNKEKILESISKEMEWLSQHPDEELNVYQEKRNEIETLMKSFVPQQEMPQEMPQHPSENEENIEEID